MTRTLLLTLLITSTSASAIVIRDDVDDAKYRISASEFPALADMPGEGHGVLIAPHWIVTAAHAVTWQPQIRQVMVNGVAREVEELVIHPGYRKPPQELLDQALATWDWTLFRASLSASDDIALIRLKDAIPDVSPIPLNTDPREFDAIVEIIGKGATGKGDAGYRFSDPHRTELRRAQNKVTSAHGRWLCYSFDKSADALPLEGGSGSGDSGGPVLMRSRNDVFLAALTSWSDPQSTVRTPGLYGQITCNVRMSYYAGWIEGVIAGHRTPGAKN